MHLDPQPPHVERELCPGDVHMGKGGGLSAVHYGCHGENIKTSLFERLQGKHRFFTEKELHSQNIVSIVYLTHNVVIQAKTVHLCYYTATYTQSSQA